MRYRELAPQSVRAEGQCGNDMFGVFADTDAVKSVSVTEGDSVTLNSDVTEVKRDYHILWVFKVDNSETRIAEIHKQIINTYNSNETFRYRLQMDSQTGSLTIRNIRSEHTGLYKLTVISNTRISYKSFNVTVYAPLPAPVIARDSLDCSPSSSSSSSESRCSLVCSAVNVSHVTLSWFKGNSLLSSISVSDLSISLSLPLEVEYQDKNTYSCVLNNPIRNHTTHLDITDLCHTCEELRPLHWVGILVGLVILLVLSAVVVKIFFRRKLKQATQQVQTCEEDVLYSKTTFRARSVHSTKATGENYVIYAAVNVT
ncbi:CD48 antigen-like [Pseudorasbora parva]|uniref:CD48 antigen-like n=1 Tax=Pseudorasbora parva TaxID=51549 RepID=UPI00351DEEDA